MGPRTTKGQVILDIGRKDVTGNADGFLLDDAAKGDDGNLSGAASDIYNHVSLRGFYVKADTKGSGHWFVDEVYVTATGVLGGVTDGPDLNLSGA